MKQYKSTQKSWKPSNPTPLSQLRQEIDAAIREITETVKKDPKKAVKVLESWVNQNQSAKEKGIRKKAA
jgi:hypothetical protein